MNTRFFKRLFIATLVITFVSTVLALWAAKKTFQEDPKIVEHVMEKSDFKWDFQNNGITIQGMDDGGSEGEFSEQTDNWELGTPSDEIAIVGVAMDVQITESTSNKINVKAQGKIDRSVFPKLLSLQESPEKTVISEPKHRSAKDVHVTIEIPKSYSGKITLKTVKGDLKISELVASEVDVEAVSGEVTADNTEIHTLVVKTVSGEVKLHPKTDGAADIFSVSGDIHVTLADPKKVSVRTTTTNGEVENSASNTSGENELKIKTVSGDIEIR